MMGKNETEKYVIIMASIKKLIKNPYKIIYILNRLGIGKYIPDQPYLKMRFHADMGRKLNLNAPQTFNEKLQWLKLYDRKPEYTMMVDKYAVKKYVADTIGEEYVIPTLGVWEHFDEIDFDSLPNQFVLKCTHDSGGLVICRDKSTLDLKDAQNKITKSLNRNYYYVGREWPYKNVKPRVIAEKYIEDSVTGDLRDYKVLCFSGEPKLIELHKERFSNHTQDFYDTDWNRQTITQCGEPLSDKVEKKPEALEKMLALSRMLAKDIPHVRVDWYLNEEKLFLGELTFYDASGFDPFDNEEDDLMIGSWISLP